MFHRRKLNNCTKRIHKGILKMIHKKYDSPFKDHLDKDESLTIGQSVTGSFKLKIGTASEVTNAAFPIIDTFYKFGADTLG